MRFIELLKTRYSVRKFEEKPVEDEKIQQILEAGRLAPTACNNQPQRILILNTEENLKKMKLCTPYTFNAPLIMLICFDKNISWKRKNDNEDMGVVDASIVATHMMLEITNIGLGSTWVGQFDVDKIINNFNLPQNYIPVVILPIGYPEKTDTPHVNHYKRIESKKIAFYNTLCNS